MRPTYSMFVLLTSKIAIVPLFKLLLLWSHGTWRISVPSTASFTLDVTLELWLGPFPPSRPKENYKASMIYLAETIALAFIGACRGTCYRPKIAKKALELQLACPQCQEPLDKGKFLFTLEVGVRDSTSWISLSTIYCPAIALMRWRSKGILEVLCWRGPPIQKRF